MLIAFVVLCMSGLLTHGISPASGELPETTDRTTAQELHVTAPPPELKLDPFYRKYISANGYPIVASAQVSDYALKEAAYLVNMMLARRLDVQGGKEGPCT